jgi:hypothetical protein
MTVIRSSSASSVFTAVMICCAVVMWVPMSPSVLLLLVASLSDLRVRRWYCSYCCHFGVDLPWSDGFGRVAASIG